MSEEYSELERMRAENTFDKARMLLTAALVNLLSGEAQALFDLLNQDGAIWANAPRVQLMVLWEVTQTMQERHVTAHPTETAFWLAAQREGLARSLVVVATDATKH
jgi:hypothetical protein